jgi:amino acid transporter
LHSPNNSAGNVIIRYWPGAESVPTGAIVAIVIALYAAINVVSVKWYGETEFWAALGKVILIGESAEKLACSKHDF